MVRMRQVRRYNDYGYEVRGHLPQDLLWDIYFLPQEQYDLAIEYWLDQFTEEKENG